VRFVEFKLVVVAFVAKSPVVVAKVEFKLVMVAFVPVAEVKRRLVVDAPETTKFKAPVSMFCGKDKVMVPVAEVALTWFAVPASDKTPLFVIATVPVAEDTTIPAPAVF